MIYWHLIWYFLTSTSDKYHFYFRVFFFSSLFAFSALIQYVFWCNERKRIRKFVYDYCLSIVIKSDIPISWITIFVITLWAFSLGNIINEWWKCCYYTIHKKTEKDKNEREKTEEKYFWITLCMLSLTLCCVMLFAFMRANFTLLAIFTNSILNSARFSASYKIRKRNS